MSHWWKYPLSEVLPFSLQIYYNLLENYGDAIWPFQFFAVISGGLLVWLMWRAGQRAAGLFFLLLGLAWLLVAWLFLSMHYALIFWAAPYFAIAFAIQACLLLVLALACAQGAVKFANQPRRKLATALFAVCVLAYPFAAVFAYGSLLPEAFGLFPGPTVVATVAALAGLKGLVRWALAIIPVFWIVVATVISATLGGYEAFILPIVTLLAIVISMAPARSSNG